VRCVLLLGLLLAITPESSSSNSNVKGEEPLVFRHP
jgi:hypothetical protein